MHARRLLTAALSLATGLSIAIPGVAANAGDTAEGAFHQTNLVSDLPGMAATTDPNLVNPWGISAAPTSPMWVSDNNAGVTTLYNGAANPPVPLVVTIPPPPRSAADAKGTPTGTVFNGTANYLYTANFRFGTIEVFDKNFNLVTLSGSFSDSRIPAGFAPFNIQELGGRLYVTYAMQKPDKHDDQAGAGFGFVDVFDLNGHLLRRLVRHGKLNSPWGLAIAPENFGPFSGALLVRNFGDGHTTAYSSRSGRFIGTLRNEAGAPIQIDGLWGIRFGNGSSGGGALAPTNTLYFAAGIGEEQHGLFGTITSVGEHED